MIDIIKKIIENIGSKLPVILAKLADCISSIFNYLENKRQDKQNDKKTKKDEQNNKNTEDIVDNGSLQDLLNKVASIIIISLIACGCASQNTLEIITTKQWEGHYFNVSDFKKSTENIKLEKNETIWVMSNNTLKKILKEKQNENK